MVIELYLKGRDNYGKYLQNVVTTEEYINTSDWEPSVSEDWVLEDDEMGFCFILITVRSAVKVK